MGELVELWSREEHSPFMWWPGWSPDGRRLATAAKSAPSIIQLLDGDTGEEAGFVKGHRRAVNACVWRPDGKMFASAGADGHVFVRGPRGGLKADHHLFKNQSESVDWSPDGKQLAVAGRDGSVLLIDPLSGEVSFSWPPGPTVLRAVWHPKGDLLAVAREDSRVLILKSRSKDQVMLVHRQGVNDVAWSPDGKRLATASADGSVREWSPNGTLLDLHLRPSWEGAASVSYSPDGKRLAAASWDGAVRVWHTGILEFQDRSGHGPPITVAWRPGGKAQLLVGRSKGDLRLLEVR